MRTAQSSKRLPLLHGPLTEARFVVALMFVFVFFSFSFSFVYDNATLQVGAMNFVSLTGGRRGNPCFIRTSSCGPPIRGSQ